VTSGCGDGGAAVLKRRSNLSMLGAAYHGFHQANGKSPVNAGELTQFMSDKSSDPQTTDAVVSLEEGEIVIHWDGVLGGARDNGRYVLGFEARAPASGGYVVMGDGEVRLMTGKEFSQAAMLPSVSGEP
jgi:hypothetical protein